MFSPSYGQQSGKQSEPRNRAGQIDRGLLRRRADSSARRLFGNRHTGSKGHGTTTTTLMNFFQVSFEGSVHFLEPLFCRELTASSKNLIAI
ncbi:MAG TPA: hypothetical protein VGK22_19680 [Candidatus Angelobacter sp.]